MKIGIATFTDRVSPRFDCARTFLLLTLEDGQGESREELNAFDWAPHERVKRLVDFGVDAVICGAIDCRSAESLRSAGVTLYGGVSGELEDALLALFQGRLQADDTQPRGKELPPQSYSSGYLRGTDK